MLLRYSSRFYRLSPFVQPYIRRIGFIFVLSSFGTVLGLLWPLFTKILIDDVLLARNVSLLFTLCGVMLAVTVLGYGIGAVNRYLYTQVTARVLFALRQQPLLAFAAALSALPYTGESGRSPVSAEYRYCRDSIRPDRRGVHVCHEYLRPYGQPWAFSSG